MLERILLQMRALIRTSRYIASSHAADEMDADGLTVFDIEHRILTGRILARQKDRQTGENKFLIHGKTLNNEDVQTIAKISPTGKLVIITVFLL
jgi:hypothetical protein